MKKLSNNLDLQQFEDFDFSRLPVRMSRCRRGSRGSCVPTSEDDLIYGVKPLSDQIRSMRAGGLPLGSRQLEDSNYDEDDSRDVDPTVEPGLDRFEKAEALSATISARMRKRHEEKLKQAKTE
jgi:hypothetical protein